MSNAKPKNKVHWYYAPAFLLFWVGLFFAVVLPVFFHLPTGLLIENENSHPGDFIAERAQRILFDFEMIGPKVVGSFANENLTVQLLHDEIDKIRNVMHHDLFELEVDVQQVSGAFIHWTMVNMYQSVQNFVVKFGAKNATSQSYLLMNSHFDSKPGSPGSGDDGAMVVIMLEILRVLATTRQVFEHPIVFLFNGAEENPLQASHGFITQHKWAKKCKALINLDSAGSGNREILFQSGPNHPWLMDYYRQHVKRPFATTVGEEIFQAGLLPSDSDFRNFRDFGKVPGLDLVHCYNGYVYHTEFDKFNIIPRGSLQTTGDNMLALARALANAPELENPKQHADGHVVFYDFLTLFIMYYTETVGIIINVIFAVTAIVICGISLWRMAAVSYLSIGKLLRTFLLIFGLHFIGFVLSVGLPILMAVMFDSGNRSLTWFTSKWMVIGLYICPTFFGLSLPTLLYLSYSRNDKLTQPFRLQMVLHSHAIILSLVLIVITAVGLRSSYLLMLSIFFYMCSMVFNLITGLHDRGYFWTIFLMLSQIMPFLYFSYLFFTLLNILIPMMGRYGSDVNPDLYVGGMCAVGTILAMGFLAPLLSIFRRPKLIVISLLIITFIFSMIALTPLGFPYRAKTHVGRSNFLEVRRVFYEYDGTVSLNESGYYFDFQDRRLHHPLEPNVDVSEMQNMSDDCDNIMMCGLPLFNHRWSKARKEARWLPTKKPLQLPGTPTLKMLQKTVKASTSSVFYEFELSGPAHMSIFISPMEGFTIKDWSFLREMLDNKAKWQPPYHIFYSYGADSTPLKFSFEFEHPNGQFDEPVFELGISAHYVSYEHQRDPQAIEFIRNLPDYIFAMEWPSSYERFIF